MAQRSGTDGLGSSNIQEDGPENISGRSGNDNSSKETESPSKSLCSSSSTSAENMGIELKVSIVACIMTCNCNMINKFISLSQYTKKNLSVIFVSLVLPCVYFFRKLDKYLQVIMMILNKLFLL